MSNGGAYSLFCMGEDHGTKNRTFRETMYSLLIQMYSYLSLQKNISQNWSDYHKTI